MPRRCSRSRARLPARWRVRGGLAATIALALPLGLGGAAACGGLAAGPERGAAPSPGASRAEAIEVALEAGDWDAARAVVESSALSRVDKNSVLAAIHHHEGWAHIDAREWGQARTDFREARRLSGNPEFWFDEAVAYRGFGNRRDERLTHQKYLEHLPRGEHATSIRTRLQQISLRPLHRPTHAQAAHETAAANPDPR